MTPDDDFGHDHEHEHEQHSPEGEWVASEPPVDDFSDEASADSATASEGNEHEHEPEVETETAESGKKKFSPLLLVGVVGVLAAGGFSFWHFAGHQNDQPSAIDTTAQNLPNFASMPSDPNAAPAATPVMAAPAQDIAPKTAYSAPSTTPETPEIDKNLPASGTAMPTLTPPPAIPASTVSSVEPPPPSKPIVPAVPMAPIAQEQPSGNKVLQDQRLEVLSSRIDDLQKSLSQTTRQLGQITDKLASLNGSSAAASSDPAMEERLSRIEQKIQQVNSSAPSHQPASQSTSSETAWPEHHTSKSRHASVTHQAHHKTVRAVVSSSHASSYSSNHWVLRAATPDEAWIATNAETRSLRPVHVGDNLDSIGAVTAIRQVGDKWVVQGSRGSIR